MTVNWNPVSAASAAQVIVANRPAIAALDAACIIDGKLQPMPSAFYELQDRQSLSAWCIIRGFYCLPTLELIDWLRERVGDELGPGQPSVIEVGAGHGAIGRALGIPTTDSREHEEPAMAAAIQAMRQGLTICPPDVEKATAAEAAEKYRPHTLIASWVTWRYNPMRHDDGGSDRGVDWRKMLAKPFLQRLIFIGHERIHAPMGIFDMPHETHRLPFLWGRPLDARNVVWIWGRS